jgi:hypothetical protein
LHERESPFDNVLTYSQVWEVWGTKVGPYEFKPAPKSKYDNMFSPLNFSAPLSLEKKLDKAYVIDDQ